MTKQFIMTNLTDPAADIVDEIKDRGISSYRLFKMSKAAKNRSTLDRWLTGLTALKVVDLIKIVKSLGYDEIVIKLKR